mmetsp:Transcript_50304/g.150265  ORF Transcript_50304/g.150265 Transcript_50304/m.150265 type:complete len:281 (+) Transcript_50304:660-1502(+)
MVPLEEHRAPEHGHHSEPGRLNLVDGREDERKQDAGQHGHQLEEHWRVSDLVLLNELREVKFDLFPRVQRQLVRQPVPEQPAGERQQEEADEGQVANEELLEAHLRHRPDDDVRGVADLRCSAPDRRADGHRKVERPGVEFHLLPEGECQRSEEEHAGDVIENHAQPSTEVGHDEEQQPWVLARPYDHLERHIVEEPSDRKHSHEDHHGEKEHERPEIDHSGNVVKVRRLHDRPDGAQRGRRSEERGIGSVDQLGHDANERDDKQHYSNDLAVLPRAGHP